MIGLANGRISSQTLLVGALSWGINPSNKQVGGCTARGDQPSDTVVMEETGVGMSQRTLPGRLGWKGKYAQEMLTQVSWCNNMKSFHLPGKRDVSSMTESELKSKFQRVLFIPTPDV